MARPVRVPVNRARSESGWKQFDEPNGAKTAVTVSLAALKLPSRPTSWPAGVLKLQFGPDGV